MHRCKRMRLRATTAIYAGVQSVTELWCSSLLFCERDDGVDYISHTKGQNINFCIDLSSSGTPPYEGSTAVEDVYFIITARLINRNINMNEVLRLQ